MLIHDNHVNMKSGDPGGAAADLAPKDVAARKPVQGG
jgi:hypothetical protein